MCASRFFKSPKVNFSGDGTLGKSDVFNPKSIKVVRFGNRLFGKY